MKYDPGLRDGAVRVVDVTKKPIAQVARDLGVKIRSTTAPPPSS